MELEAPGDAIAPDRASICKELGRVMGDVYGDIFCINEKITGNLVLGKKWVCGGFSR